jgi:hypothetical protein
MCEISFIIGFLVVATVVILIWVAANQKPPFPPPPPPPLPPPPPPPNLPPNTNDWIRTAYTATTSLYIEVDREIWQVSTIFMTASILLMGWVVTNLYKLNMGMTMVIGCASIILVGMATLFKFRLRRFNLVHIENLKRIEQAALGIDAANYFGVHHMRFSLKPEKWWQELISIHGLMLIYFVLFTLIWLAIWAVQ